MTNCDDDKMELVHEAVRLRDDQMYCHLQLWMCAAGHLHLHLHGHVGGSTPGSSASGIVFMDDLKTMSLRAEEMYHERRRHD